MKGDTISRDWRRLHNSEPSGLYASDDIIHIIESRLQWARSMTYMDI